MDAYLRFYDALELDITTQDALFMYHVPANQGITIKFPSKLIFDFLVLRATACIGPDSGNSYSSLDTDDSPLDKGLLVHVFFSE
jgi:hypothetical protein